VQGAFGALMLIVKLNGTEAALRQYSEFKKSGGGTYKVEEGTLNRLGYRLLGSGQEQDAITVFRRNVQEYPKSAHAYDSLGEAYLKMGQKDLAVRNYETSLRLDPTNQRAIDAIKELKKVN
jgi:Flp pilus assembly protein TadD